MNLGPTHFRQNYLNLQINKNLEYFIYSQKDQLSKQQKSPNS